MLADELEDALLVAQEILAGLGVRGRSAGGVGVGIITIGVTGRRVDVGVRVGGTPQTVAVPPRDRDDEQEEGE